MTTFTPGVTVTCDKCGAIFPTKCRTSQGARGVAHRGGWRTATLTDGYHTSKKSGDPKAADLCVKCAPARTFYSGPALWDEAS